MHLTLSWPEARDAPLHECFFVGGWHVKESLQLDWPAPPKGGAPVLAQGKNWFLLSSRSGAQSHEPGLVHAETSSNVSSTAVAFRGSLFEPPIHSYSPSHEILKYWQQPNKIHNGIFAAARVSHNGACLELVSDIFGVSPLYFRAEQNLILFATSPRYLRMASDQPDYLAYRCMVQHRFIPSDRSLTRQIRRAPPGSMLRFDARGRKEYRWIDYETLPDGTRKIDQQGVKEAEESFQAAMGMAANLKLDRSVLPLSGGYDSRRILAGLVQRGAAFEAYSVERPGDEKLDYLELDAFLAGKLSAKFDFPLTIIKADLKNEIHFDRQRRRLLAGESFDHTWQAPLFTALAGQACLFYDGLGGDVLYESGYFIDGLHKDNATDMSLIVGARSHAFDDALNPGIWPSASDARNEVLSYLDTLPKNKNLSEFSFFLLRMRRSTSLAQNLMSAEHVPVYPFMELGHMSTLLQFRPEDKWKILLQRECLKQFWRGYFEIPTTRTSREDLRREFPNIARNSKYDRLRLRARFNGLKDDLEQNGGWNDLKHLVKPSTWRKIQLSRVSNVALGRWGWMAIPLMEIVCQHSMPVPAWRISQSASASRPQLEPSVL